MVAEYFPTPPETPTSLTHQSRTIDNKKNQSINQSNDPHTCTKKTSSRPLKKHKKVNQTPTTTNRCEKRELEKWRLQTVHPAYPVNRFGAVEEGWNGCAHRQCVWHFRGHFAVGRRCRILHRQSLSPATLNGKIIRPCCDRKSIGHRYRLCRGRRSDNHRDPGNRHAGQNVGRIDWTAPPFTITLETRRKMKKRTKFHMTATLMSLFIQWVILWLMDWLIAVDW